MLSRCLTGSMIFVFERSLAVGRWPSIHIYSAVIFATTQDLLGRMREDSRKRSRNGAARLEELAPGPADHELVLARRFAAVHGRVGAPEEARLLLVDGARGARIAAAFGDAARPRHDP